MTGSWIITNAPVSSRGSSNVHGPATDGPTRVVSEEAVRQLLKRYYNRPDDEINVALTQIKRGVFG
jgi:hypothetical protein